jgi:hypothetical protein
MTSVRDIIIIASILFAVAISLVIVLKVGHTINSEMLKVTAINDSAEAKAVINSADAAINYMDYLYLSGFIAFFISIIIFGWFIDGSSIMAPIYFFLVVLFTFFSIIFQEIWKDFVLTPSLVSTMVNLPITNYIVAHLGYFIAVFGLVGIIMMYAKPQAVGGTF